MKKIAITIGDPAGIGPEIIIKALDALKVNGKEYLLIGNKQIFLNTANQLGLSLDESIDMIDIHSNISKIRVGQNGVESGRLSFLALETACKLAKLNKIKAIVTAPLSKKAINMAGYNFSGQTEVLKKYLMRTTCGTLKKDFDISNKPEAHKLPQDKSQHIVYYCNSAKGQTSFHKKDSDTECKNSNDITCSSICQYLNTVDASKTKNFGPEMLFVARDFRIMLLTRHIELIDVSNALNINDIVESICALNKSLMKDFNVSQPRIAICGLNPHAGEDGLLGEEETEVIIPAIEKLRSDFNINIRGPFPADTMWLKAAKPYLKKTPQPYDAYVACYHDQGLIPIKLLAMESTVNVTINLPIIRTSPSHGTAFDIAGEYKANSSSMEHAIKLANEMLEMSEKNKDLVLNSR